MLFPCRKKQAKRVKFMSYGKKRNLIAYILFNPGTLAFLGVAIIVLISFPIAKNVSQRHNINKEVKELENEIKLIEDKNAQLQKLIDYLSSEQYVEEQARLNFGLKKEGEETVVVNIGGDSSAPVGAERLENAEELSSPSGKAKSGLAKSIYNIPALEKSDKAEPRKKIGNPERWWKYFFGG